MRCTTAIRAPDRGRAKPRGGTDEKPMLMQRESANPDCEHGLGEDSDDSLRVWNVETGRDCEMDRPPDRGSLERFAAALADRAGVRNSSPINQIAEQTPAPPPVDNQRVSPLLANRIRELAGDVRRIGRGRRCDAESIAIDKDCIAVELGRLACRLDRRAAQ